ncbi:MAG: methylmalonyl Co-A mutase-associated GTPase MeaB [Acidimicrobiales bacterium]
MPVARDSDPSSLFEEARTGSRVALARLLSMVERGGDPSRIVAGLAYKSPGAAYTVGITGAPGAGKSTLTDRLIVLARQQGLDGGGQVGVLAVDPSSPFSGGAILGDRVRMQSHALDDGVFIRSMATRGHLGGLSVAVPDAVRVLSAVGMPVVIVETVGVGQQEVEVAAATDTTVVVVNPGWGDHIQANKAGLLEIADLFVINKADRPGARETRRDLEAMLELTPLDEDQWRPPIVETVASTGDGVDDLWAAIGRHRLHQTETGLLAAARRRRLLGEFDQLLVARVRQQIEDVLAADQFADITEAMVAGDLDPYEAVDRVLSAIAPDRHPPVRDA